MALNKPRDTIECSGVLLSIPVAANAVLFAGALAAVNATGFATPGAVAATLKGAGRVEATVDNTGGADGAKSVTIKRGVFKFKNHGADAITQADLLADCFIVDDETVAKTNGGNTRSKAGKIVEVEATGVWVEFS
jgi:hypothetical protein